MKGDVSGDNGIIRLNNTVFRVIQRCGFPDAINIVNGDLVFRYNLNNNNIMRVRFEAGRVERIVVTKPGAGSNELEDGEVEISLREDDPED